MKTSVKNIVILDFVSERFDYLTLIDLDNDCLTPLIPSYFTPPKKENTVNTDMV